MTTSRGATLVMTTIVMTLVMTLVMVSTEARIITPDQLVALLNNASTSLPSHCKPSPRARIPTRPPCSLLMGQLAYGGQCVDLLTRGPCRELHWIITDRDTGAAKCAYQVCVDHEVLVSGVCERLGAAASARHCPPTQQLIINEHGQAECECALGHVFYSKTQRCHEPHETGPCGHGQVVMVVDNPNGNGGMANCVQSLCPSGEIAMSAQCTQVSVESIRRTSTAPPSYQCYKLYSEGPCKNNSFLAVDAGSSEVVCTANALFAIYTSHPSRPCSRGSRRDSMNQCREALQMKLTLGGGRGGGKLSLAPTVKPGLHPNGKICPDGYFYLGGSCIHLIRDN